VRRLHADLPGPRHLRRGLAGNGEGSCGDDDERQPKPPDDSIV